MKKIQKFIEKVLFGDRAQGQPVPPPSFRSSYPNPVMPEDDWTFMVKFGSRYGHRGSFYYKN